MQKKLPIGIENFEDMIKENYYYVDKTGLLKQLLNEHGLVNLFTRPRRFGKSLNMSMLKYFFEIYFCNSSGFKIMQFVLFIFTSFKNASKSALISGKVL